MTPPSLSYKSYKSYQSYASVTPPQTAYPRCHQVAKHTQRYLFAPSKTRQRHRKPTGYHMTHLSCQTRQTCQTGQTQASRPRDTHTPAAIKLPSIPCSPPATFSQQLRECSKHGICPVCNNFISPFKINFCRL